MPPINDYWREKLVDFLTKPGNALLPDIRIAERFRVKASIVGRYRNLVHGGVHPKDWLLCPACEGNRGNPETQSECLKCDGYGFLIPSRLGATDDLDG